MAWFTDHSLILLLSIAALFTGFWLYVQRVRLRLRIGWILLLSPVHVIVGVLCVKVFAALETFSLDGFRNMSLFGAIFLLPLFYWAGAKLSRRKAADVFDVFTVPTVFTLACARVNCIVSGCCLGRIISGTGQRWPTREAELVFYAVLLPLLILRGRKKGSEGTLWPFYMTAYGVFRFITEFFRESETNTLFHLSHLWAILCLLIGVSALLEMNRQKIPASHGPQSQHRRKRT